MPRATGDFEVRGGADLARIVKELRSVSAGYGAEIRRRMLREIRAEAKPLVPQVRRAILSIPTKGEGSTGLRRRMAKAVTLAVRLSGRDAGVTIRVDGRKMPAGQKNLPAYMEGSKRPWRHPVFGNRDTWVAQPSHPYFFKIVRPFGARARRGVLRALDSISRDIT